DHRDPAVAVAILVEELGVLDQRLVGLDHLARDRRVELGDSLHGVDRAELVAALEPRADGGELHLGDLAELLLCVGGDSDADPLALEARPLVFLRVEQIVGYVVVGHGCLAAWWLQAAPRRPARGPRTNGVSTMRAGAARPRITIWTSLPTAANGGGT